MLKPRGELVVLLGSSRRAVDSRDAKVSARDGEHLHQRVERIRFAAFVGADEVATAVNGRP